jgi:hypothetical protein
MYIEMINKIIIVGLNTIGMKTMGGYVSTREGAKGGSKGKPMSFARANVPLPNNPSFDLFKLNH